MSQKNSIKCCLCGIEVPSKESHNAAPVVDDGRCCLECNKKVIAARLHKVMQVTFEKINRRRNE